MNGGKKIVSLYESGRELVIPGKKRKICGFNFVLLLLREILEN